MHAPLSTLRDKKTLTKEFRRASRDITIILAKETARRLRKEQVTDTGKVVLVPVLRAGLALLPIFLETFPSARVGFIGLKRNEKTFKVKKYYQHLPRISKSDRIIVLDPMLATGGSAVVTIEEIIKNGAREENILFVGVISSPEGLNTLAKKFPRVDTVIAVNDQGLNKKKYIVPGLGDFGDRYFGT